MGQSRVAGNPMAHDARLSMFPAREGAGYRYRFISWRTILPNDEHDRSDVHPEGPWWWGIGPVGAVLLIVIGIAGTLWVFLWSDAADDTTAGYQTSRVIAIGLVLLGAAVLERFRSRRSRAHEVHEARKAEDRQNS